MVDTTHASVSDPSARASDAACERRASRPADAHDRADASVLTSDACPATSSERRGLPHRGARVAPCAVASKAKRRRGGSGSLEKRTRTEAAGAEDAADAAETDTAWRDAYEDAVVPFVLGGYARVRRSRDAWYLTSADETRVLGAVVTTQPVHQTETRELRVSRALLDVALDRAGRPFDAVPRLRTPDDAEAWLAKIVAASERPPARARAHRAKRRRPAQSVDARARARMRKNDRRRYARIRATTAYQNYYRAYRSSVFRLPPPCITSP